MLPLMIRRPPSIIFLGDEELRYYLRRTFLRSLSIDFGRLNLNHQDRNYDYERDNLFDPSSSGDSSDDSDEDVDAKQSRVVQSSSVGTRSVPGVITSPVEESALTESAHQTVDTINAPATRLGLSLSSQTRRKVTWAALPQGERFIYLVGKEENCRRYQHALTTENDEHSRLPTIQDSRQSPTETVNAVPLRGLTLASIRSDEAGLASSTILAAISVGTQLKKDTITHRFSTIEQRANRDFGLLDDS